MSYIRARYAGGQEEGGEKNLPSLPAFYIAHIRLFFFSSLLFFKELRVDCIAWIT